MRLVNETDDDEFLEYLNSDDALFHYTSKCTALEKILPKQELKFGTFSGTNDPQEYRLKLPGAVGWGWGETSREVSDATKEIEIICQKRSWFISFCTNSFEDNKLIESGILKSRMWSQYGDNHEGVCLVFSKKQLLNDLEIFKSKHQKVICTLVKYRNPDRHDQPILHVNKSDFKDKNYNDIAIKFVLDNQESYLFSKQTDYIDECEFRVVLMNMKPNVERDSSRMMKVGNSLVGAVFGDKFHEVYTPSVKELARGSNITPRKLVWNKGGYYLFELRDNKI